MSEPKPKGLALAIDVGEDPFEDAAKDLLLAVERKDVHAVASALRAACVAHEDREEPDGDEGEL